MLCQLSLVESSEKKEEHTPTAYINVHYKEAERNEHK
jgi:hypothetical protein